MHKTNALRITRFVAAASLLMAGAWSQAQDMAGLAFMTGNWLEAKDGAEVQETWAGPKAELMVAVNLTRTRAGKGEFEFLRIAKGEDGKITYFASPGGRSPATPFPLKELAANRVVFENPDKPFPRRIIYQRRDDDTLVARIEGTINGQDRAQEWALKRQR
jgi:hypothetical protein